MNRSEIDAILHDLIVWTVRQREGPIFRLGMRIVENLELDDPPLPILAGQVEQLAALVGRKAKM